MTTTEIPITTYHPGDIVRVSAEPHSNPDGGGYVDSDFPNAVCRVMTNYDHDVEGSVRVVRIEEDDDSSNYVAPECLTLLRRYPVRPLTVGETVRVAENPGTIANGEGFVAAEFHGAEVIVERSIGDNTYRVMLPSGNSNDIHEYFLAPQVEAPDNLSVPDLDLALLRAQCAEQGITLRLARITARHAAPGRAQDDWVYPALSRNEGGNCLLITPNGVGWAIPGSDVAGWVPESMNNLGAWWIGPDHLAFLPDDGSSQAHPDKPAGDVITVGGIRYVRTSVVWDKAMEVAATHDLCPVVERTLREMGLTPEEDLEQRTLRCGFSGVILEIPFYSGRRVGSRQEFADAQRAWDAATAEQRRSWVVNPTPDVAEIDSYALRRTT